MYGQKGCLHQCTARGGSVSQPCLCRTEPQSPGGGSGWAPGETQQQSGPGSGQQLVQKVIQEQGSDAFPLVAQVEYGEVLTVPLMSMPLDLYSVRDFYRWKSGFSGKFPATPGKPPPWGENFAKNRVWGPKKSVGGGALA